MAFLFGSYFFFKHFWNSLFRTVFKMPSSDSFNKRKIQLCCCDKVIGYSFRLFYTFPYYFPSFLHLFLEMGSGGKEQGSQGYSVLEKLGDLDGVHSRRITQGYAFQTLMCIEIFGDHLKCRFWFSRTWVACGSTFATRFWEMQLPLVHVP